MNSAKEKKPALNEIQDDIIYDHVPDIKIPESQGDRVDQAQDQIESELHEQIYQARKGLEDSARTKEKFKDRLLGTF